MMAEQGGSWLVCELLFGREDRTGCVDGVLWIVGDFGSSIPRYG